MAVTVDAKKVMEILPTLVEERGHDYIYPGSEGRPSLTCLYVDGLKWVLNEEDDEVVADFSNAAPGCIVGTFFHHLGLTFPEIVGEGASYNAGTPASCLVDHLNAVGLVKVTEAASDLLSHAQGKQDEGSTWGDALISTSELFKYQQGRSE